MNTYLLTVANTGSASNRRPGIYLYGKWLHDMGFIPGALVQAIPEPGGMVLTLCNENIPSYSELDTATRERGGKLIQSYCIEYKSAQYPALMTNGQYLLNAGMNFGDALVAQYTPGFIHVRKLPATARVIRVTNLKDSYTGKPSPKVQLHGEWLLKFGFDYHSLVTTLSEPGLITFQLRDGSVENYKDLVRFARQHKMKLSEVRERLVRGKPYPCIMTTGSCLDKAGFNFGDELLASCENGLIKLQKLDSQGLGF